MRSVSKSFYDWCMENNRMDLNDRFDIDKNGRTTKDISYKSNKKMWFKCPRNLHNSEQHAICVITRDANVKINCSKCFSVAQVIIDKFGEDYLVRHWSDQNQVSPWDVSYGHSRLKVMIQCSKKDYHVYEQTPQSFCRGVGCPYCDGKLIHPNDSIAVKCPDIVNIWSTKNAKGPHEYAVKSNKKVWLRCSAGKHEDYLQSLNAAFKSEYRCYDCYKESLSEQKKGSGNYFWKGGINDDNDTLRHRREYKEWRNAVYERDNYTCQCCGARGGKLNAHHINQFSDYPEIRYDVNNGITMCDNCHDSTKDGSFHNVYGTHNTTPEHLREYILHKSNKDIFEINPKLLYNTKLT